ncbi:MAG: cupin domain-containing protein, partial [Deltaproteobacteria bacterium]|nr:cupin domain-containing protein [Deltaproteobacteria bacterium]
MIRALFLALALVHLICVPALAREAGVVSQKLVQSSESWNGAALPDYPAGRPEITILRITIPAGATLPRHKHPVINAGVLLSGELVVTTSQGQVLPLQAGAPIVEVVETWHTGRNPGAVPAEIIVFYAGSVGDTPIHVIDTEQT